MKTIDNTDERERILEKYFDKDSNGWGGGIRCFENVPLPILEELVGKKFLELNERQEDSPTTRELIKFIAKWDKVMDIRAHGYIVSNERPDNRITLTGLQILRSPTDPVRMPNPAFIKAWYSFNRDANELTDAWSWWD